MHIVLPIAKIGRILLDIVTDIFRMLDPGSHGTVPSDGNRHGNPLVECAESDGLPTAARKAGYP